MANNFENMHITDEQLFDWIDGTCTAQEQKQYEAHLAACTACRTLWEEYRAIDVQLSTAALERAPGHFTDKLMGTWEDSKQIQTNWVYRRPKSLYWAAAIAVCSLLVVSFHFLMGSLAVAPEYMPTSAAAWSPKMSVSTLAVTQIGAFFQQAWLVQGFLLVNVLLILLLFDKMVLKPFFERKRQALLG